MISIRDLESPGGGVALNNMSDLISPKYIFQRWYRFTIPINQIRMINLRDKETITENKYGFHTELNRPRPLSFTSSFSHYLDFNGSFGAVSLKLSQRKRDEAYSFLQQYVSMGVPIVKTEPLLAS